MRQPLRIVNRVVLGLVGLTLFGLGLAAVVAALDLPGRWGSRHRRGGRGAPPTTCR